MYVGTQTFQKHVLRLSSNWLVSNCPWGAGSSHFCCSSESILVLYVWPHVIGPFSTTLVPLSSSSSVDRQVLINVDASAISPDERTFGFIFTKTRSQGVRIKEIGPDRPYFQFVCAPPTCFAPAATGSDTAFNTEPNPLNTPFVAACREGLAMRSLVGVLTTGCFDSESGFLLQNTNVLEAKDYYNMNIN